MSTDALVVMVYSRECINRLTVLKRAIASQDEILEAFCEIINLAEEQCFLIEAGKYDDAMCQYMTNEVLVLLRSFERMPEFIEGCLGSYALEPPGWKHVICFTKEHGLNNLHAAITSRLVAPTLP